MAVLLQALVLLPHGDGACEHSATSVLQLGPVEKKINKSK